MIQPLSRYMPDAASSAGATRNTGSGAHAAQRTNANRTGADRTNSGSTGESAGAEGASGESAVSGAGALANKQTFLTLLVAQIKNQNPLNPADGTEFLSQLAQFSELEQLISIRQELESIGKSNPPAESTADSAA